MQYYIKQPQQSARHKKEKQMSGINNFLQANPLSQEQLGQPEKSAKLATVFSAPTTLCIW